MWAARQSVLLIAGVYLLSPLYSTLAKAISDDTVMATSIWLLLTHLYMHDYFFEKSVADKLSGSLAMAAAVAASVLLASRLGEPLKVVCMPSPVPSSASQQILRCCSRPASLHIVPCCKC
jgi:hypothetical protein